MTTHIRFVVFAFFALTALAFGSAQERSDMKLASTAFANGQAIPRQYTCEGIDASPELSWSGQPASTKTFALIVDDPDAPAGTWVHWVVYNLPSSTNRLAEAIPKNEMTAGGTQGKNDSKKTGYNGPCPPPGKRHRYFFKLYALNTQLDLQPGAAKNDVEAAMNGHILAKAELIGTYERHR